MTPEQRHKNMAAIHSQDTKPELVVRKYLWAHGYRYRLNHPRLPGKPDVVLLKYRTCIFVNGCFWHGHGIATNSDGNRALPLAPTDGGNEQPLLQDSDCCKIPHTNRPFWVRKILRNQQRDKEVLQQLAVMGWNSITVWECQLKPDCRQQTLQALEYRLNTLFLDGHRPKTYSQQEESSPMAAEEGN